MSEDEIDKQKEKSASVESVTGTLGEVAALFAIHNTKLMAAASSGDYVTVARETELISDAYKVVKTSLENFGVLASISGKLDKHRKLKSAQRQANRAKKEFKEKEKESKKKEEDAKDNKAVAQMESAKAVNTSKDMVKSSVNGVVGSTVIGTSPSGPVTASVTIVNQTGLNITETLNANNMAQATASETTRKTERNQQTQDAGIPQIISEVANMTNNIKSTLNALNIDPSTSKSVNIPDEIFNF